MVDEPSAPRVALAANIATESSGQHPRVGVLVHTPELGSPSDGITSASRASTTGTTSTTGQLSHVLGYTTRPAAIQVAWIIGSTDRSIDRSKFGLITTDTTKILCDRAGSRVDTSPDSRELL